MYACICICICVCACVPAYVLRAHVSNVHMYLNNAHTNVCFRVYMCVRHTCIETHVHILYVCMCSCLVMLYRNTCIYLICVYVHILYVCMCSCLVVLLCCIETRVYILYVCRNTCVYLIRMYGHIAIYTTTLPCFMRTYGNIAFSFVQIAIQYVFLSSVYI